MRRMFAQILVGGFLLAASKFTVSVNATTLTATVWADEAYEVYVSHSDRVAGTLFLEGSGGGEDPQTGTVELVEGEIQYLHILVKDELADPSALIGSFSLNDFGFVFPNLFDVMSTDSTYWKVGRQTWESNLDFLTELGVNGTAPFGQKTGINADANYLWSEGGPGVRYFTLALHPTNSTPRRFDIGYQPFFNSLEELKTKTEGVPNSIVYENGPSRALALAYPGRVGARVEETLTQGPGDMYTAAWAGFDSPDFVLTTTGSETSADISLNFMVKGTIIGGAGKGGLPVETSTSFSELNFYARVNNGPVFYTIGRINARYEVGTETPGTEVTVSDLHGRNLFPADVAGDAGEFLAEYNVTIDKMFTTPAQTIEVGVPFSAQLSTQFISAVTSDAGHALSTMDFTGGISFPTQGPVFNVPEGFTVNSISGTIRDNLFEGDIVPQSKKILVPGLFMQAGDIAGESRAEGREDWTDLLEVSSGLFRLTQGRDRQAALHDDVELTKRIDKSSPKLAEALVQGKVLAEVIIEHNQQVSEDLWKRFEFRLANAQVTGFQLSGQSSESQPLESVAFNYEKIDWIYELCNSQGVGQGRVEANWDLVTNTGGSSSSSGDNQPPGMEPVGNQSINSASTASINLVIADSETDAEDLEVSVSTSRPDLIGDLQITGTGANRNLSFKTSALFSGFASVVVTVSDGTDSRSSAIPVLIDVEMTPYEGYLAAYFGEDQLDNQQLVSPILDPDKDNIPTIIEYLLGTNPMEYNKASEAIEVAFNLDGENCNCTLNFNKRLDDPNVRGYFWVSENMKDWVRMDATNPLYEETLTEGQNPDFGQAEVSIAFPDVCQEPKFIRFQVTDVF